MPEHVWYEYDDGHSCNDMGECMLCSLAVCKICYCAEGGLPTDCPGEIITGPEQDVIYKGFIDYKDGLGWYQGFNPTNLSWLYGRYIRFYENDKKFMTQEKLSPFYFKSILKEWKNNNWKLEKI